MWHPVERDRVYRALLGRMGEVRAVGWDALVGWAGEKVVSEPVHVGNAEVWLDVEVRWADERREKIVVWGTVSGSNVWAMERVDEKMVVERGGG